MEINYNNENRDAKKDRIENLRNKTNKEDTKKNYDYLVSKIQLLVDTGILPEGMKIYGEVVSLKSSLKAKHHSEIVDKFMLVFKLLYFLNYPDEKLLKDNIYSTPISLKEIAEKSVDYMTDICLIAYLAERSNSIEIAFIDIETSTSYFLIMLKI